MGHTVRIMPAQFVKPYVKFNKSDIIDAAAIAEAVTRASMRSSRFDPGADRHPSSASHPGPHDCSEDGVDLSDAGVLFGVWDRDPPRGWQVQSRPARVLANEDNDLTPAMRRMLAASFEELKELEVRIAGVNREIESIAASSEKVRRLMTIPGIGPLAATALLAATGSGQQFRRGRDMTAWLGLVPREHSTGGKTKLIGVSKRGNTYLRRMLIHGARSCVLHLDRSRDRLGAWLDCLEKRMHRNKVTVALAAKLPALPGRYCPGQAQPLSGGSSLELRSRRFSLRGSGR